MLARSLTTGRGSAGQAVVLRRALVISQSALSMVLLVGGGVFFESLSHVRSIDVGYDVERLISGTVRFRDPQARYEDTESHSQEMGLGLEQIATDLAREVESLADVITPQLRPWRVGASLFSGFGVLALIIAFVESMGSLPIASRSAPGNWDCDSRSMRNASRSSPLLSGRVWALWRSASQLAPCWRSSPDARLRRCSTRPHPTIRASS
jgi:hypothetical protein